MSLTALVCRAPLGILCRSPLWTVHTIERLGQFPNEVLKLGLQHPSPGHYDVIEVMTRMRHLYVPDRRFQTAPYPVALDRAADGAGDREAEPRLCRAGRCARSLTCLQRECPRRAAAAFADGKEILATFERCKAPC